MSSFGNFVKKLRNEAGLSQEKLADKMDVSVNTIQNWESGNTRINPDKFGSLAHILNVPKDELVREYCRDDDGSRSDVWPSFLFDDTVNQVVETFHLNINQQNLFGLLYIKNAVCLKKDFVDFETMHDDLKLIPYEFICQVGSIQFLNIVEGLYRIMKYVKTDFLLKILRLNPESEFDVKRMTKDQICEFIDEGCKKRNDLQFGISMKKARAVLPIMEQKPLCITERLYGEIRKDIPRELIETLYVPVLYEDWLKKYDSTRDKFYGRWVHWVIKGLEKVAVYNNSGGHYLEMNDTGRQLLEWINERK